MTGILPSYQRFVNGVPVPSFSRRSFRFREKYLILLVLFTFAIIWFGASFFLPEFKSSSSTVNENVFKVYQKIQKAGPELLIPAPPPQNERPFNARPGGIEDDFHKLDDRNRLLAKIQQDDGLKVLERPNIGKQPSSSSTKKVPLEAVNQIPNADKQLSMKPPISKDFLQNLGEDSDPEVRKKRNTVKEMMRHAWSSYKKYAWGKNELKPISKRAHLGSVFGSGDLGATIVDGLDTLYIMGLNDEFQEGKDWVAKEFKIDNAGTELSVFETTIRYIGGFLSCYSLTGDTMFKNKAVEVADSLLPAFDTPTNIPYSLINPRTKTVRQYHWAGSSSILSEIGTLHLEFVYLSDVTGNDVYREKVEKIRDALVKIHKPDGFYMNFINPRTGNWGQRHVSLGALGDSFYEYLLKSWIQSDKQDKQAINMFDEAMKHVQNKMVRISPGGLTYVADLKYGRIVEEKMDHLSCFAGGMFALASQTHETQQSDQYMYLGKELTKTCHESYDRSTTKLGPEAFRFSPSGEARATKSNEKYNLLRPETYESYFILWRLTHDQKYRDWGWEAVQAIERYCRVEGGYTGLLNVYHKQPQGDDVQQSFFLAETLKYLYLLFSDDSLIPLDKWVFNTEAHPLPIVNKNPMYRPADDHNVIEYDNFDDVNNV